MNSKLIQQLKDDKLAVLCRCCRTKLTTATDRTCVVCWTHVRPCAPDEGGEG